MPKFDPDNCRYCFKETGQKICQMPYSIVKQLLLLDESIDSIMKMTKLHSDYTDKALQNNLSFETWKQSFPEGSQTMAEIVNSIDYFKSIGSPPASGAPSRRYSSIETQTDHEFVLNEDEQAVLISPKRESEAQTDIAPIIEDDVQRTESPSPLINQDDKESVTTVNATDMTRSSTDQGSDKKGQWTLASKVVKQQASTKATDVKPETAKKATSTVKKLPRKQLQHLIDDLMIVADSTQGLSSKGKQSTYLSKVFESILVEQKSRAYFKDGYSPTITSSLDHPIAISRKIQTHHSFEDMSKWQAGQHATCSRLCLLNFPPMMSTSPNLEKDLIIPVFLSYFRSVLTRDTLHQDDVNDVTIEIKERLSRQGKHTTYSWVKNQIMIQGIKPQLAQTPTTAKVQTSWLFHVDGTHECPPLNERITPFIEKNLNGIIASSLSPELQDRINPPEGFTVNELIRHLVTEFISHNKGWTNPNSFSDTKHLSKMELYLDTVFPEDQIEPIFLAMAKVIHDFRTVTKPLPT